MNWFLVEWNGVAEKVGISRPKWQWPTHPINWLQWNYHLAGAWRYLNCKFTCARLSSACVQKTRFDKNFLFSSHLYLHLEPLRNTNSWLPGTRTLTSSKLPKHRAEVTAICGPQEMRKRFLRIFNGSIWVLFKVRANTHCNTQTFYCILPRDASALLLPLAWKRLRAVGKLLEVSLEPTTTEL